MDVSKIAARMKIVTYELSHWTGKGNNKQVVEETNAKHGTNKCKSASVVQCEHPLLAQIAQVHQNWREYNERMTKPTIHKGMRLLPAGAEFEHVQKTSEFRQQHDDLVDQFVPLYPALAAAAPLMPLYDPKKWPRDIKSKFGFHVRYMICPTEGDWADWLQASVYAAMDAIKEDLKKSIAHVAEQCASKGRLYESVFGNLREILRGIPDFDPDGVLDDFKAKIAPLAEIEAEDLRKDRDKRDLVADQANQLLSIFGTGTMS